MRVRVAGFCGCALCFFLPLGICGQNVDAWDRALRAHVTLSELDGIKTHVVDYAAMATDPDFVLFVQSLDGAVTHGLSRNETYALFMNAYNALAIKMVVDHACLHSIFGSCKGPISSIKDIGWTAFGPVSTVWLKPAGRIGNKMYSLQQIEDFLRAPSPYSEDARLHACIVCASISCPNLRAEAFRANTVDKQMDDQMRDMLKNPLKGFSLNRQTDALSLSNIFNWYAKDFAKAAGSVVDFLLPYVASDADSAYLKVNKDKVALSYFPYNWNTNGRAPCNCTTVRPVAKVFV